MLLALFTILMMQHTPFDPLPLPTYENNKNLEKQLNSHVQKLKKQYNSKEMKKLINKAKETWEQELIDQRGVVQPIKIDDNDHHKASRKEKRTLKKQQHDALMLKEIENEPIVDHKLIELSLLSAKLKEYHLSLHDMLEIQGDGDCLFSAVVYQLQQLDIQTDVPSLRNDVVQYIKQHKCDFEPFFSDALISFDVYLEEMLKKRWGRHLELKAITQLYNININLNSVNGLLRMNPSLTINL